LLGARELLEHAQNRPCLALVVEALVDLAGKVVHALARKAGERVAVAARRERRVLRITFVATPSSHGSASSRSRRTSLRRLQASRNTIAVSSSACDQSAQRLKQ
jgi:hypothetical protein